MAKGDDARARNRIDYEGERARTLGENLRTGTLEPNVGMFRDQFFQPAAQQQMQDYGNLMGGYRNFAETGGFQPGDIEAIRARSISPTRSIYQNAQRNVSRQRALQGGFSPGYSTMMGRFAREGSQALSDANLNAEAAIAQMVQQGKLAGLQGGTSLFSATPGMAATFGNQVLGATGQLLGGVGNEMDLGTRLAGLQIQAGQLPGKWEHTVGRIGDILNIGKQVGSMAYPWLQKMKDRGFRGPSTYGQEEGDWL